MQDQILKLRKEYGLHGLDVDDLKENPIDLFKIWLQQAIKAGVAEPNAMTLATVNEFGQPSIRVVLLRDITDAGFTFYTNYNSKKGKEIEGNVLVSLNFFWPQLERQIRIDGKIEKLSEATSQAYFAKRPRGSQIGAWASPQSQIIESRKWLLDQAELFEQKFKGVEVPKPAHWGGYLVVPELIEFWQGRENRMHDRFQYLKSKGTSWQIARLAP
jgi:pyridoxamine 5'-phosphate oxidase